MADGCGISTRGGNPPGSSALGPWSVVAEIDFAAESVGIDLTNGDHTLNDGRVWTAANRGAATTFRCNPGSGLEFAANGTNGQWNTAPAQTASVLWISLNDTTLGAGRQLCPTYDVNRQYLWQMHVTSTNADAATEGCYLNLWTPADNQAIGTPLAIGGAWLGSNATVLANRGVGLTSGTTTPILFALTNARYTGSNVVGMTVPPGYPNAMQASSGIYGSDWPAMASLSECGYFGAVAAGAAALSSLRYNDPSMRLAIAFPTSNTSATFSAIVRRFRMLARQPN